MPILPLDLQKKIRLIIIKIINAKDKNVIIIPKPEAIESGTSEKLTIPSNAYLNNFQKFHLVSPATRSTFSNGNQYVLNPIHPNIPFEKRLFSCIATIALTIDFFINLKSRAPSTISASEILFIIL